jgi:broad specificity phosphatase PhoE
VAARCDLHQSALTFGKTAEAIAKHYGLQVQQHPGLADIDYGEWQGLTPEEARQRWPEEIDAWYNQPHQAHIPGGETLDDLRARAMLMVKSWLTGTQEKRSSW